ncbi:MAG: hypothetical protein IKR69_00795 [Bacteroidales bacterium]|nr:hypothetical protein [Bacteroidales bacterium]
MKDVLKRYSISTLGLIFVALGVGLSIKSNLGIAPPSCPPTIFNLKWTGISVGTFVWMLNLSFIVIQLILLGKKFRAEDLMQIPSAFAFGYLCDGAIWLFNSLEAPATDYFVQILLILAAVLMTAIGIKLEVVGKGWILAGDRLTAVISDLSKWKFSNIKIAFDIILVAGSAIFGLIVFSNPAGNGSTFVIREGTLIMAVFTGLCMKLTDPIIDRLFK